MIWRFACNSLKYPLQSQVFGDFTSFRGGNVKKDLSSIWTFLGLETYVNSQLKMYAQSYAPGVFGNLLTKIKLLYGSWRRRLWAGIFFFYAGRCRRFLWSIREKTQA